MSNTNHHNRGHASLFFYKQLCKIWGSTNSATLREISIIITSEIINVQQLPKNPELCCLANCNLATTLADLLAYAGLII